MIISLKNFTFNYENSLFMWYCKILYYRQRFVWFFLQKVYEYMRKICDFSWKGSILWLMLRFLWNLRLYAASSWQKMYKFFFYDCTLKQKPFGERRILLENHCVHTSTDASGTVISYLRYNWALQVTLGDPAGSKLEEIWACVQMAS